MNVDPRNGPIIPAGLRVFAAESTAIEVARPQPSDRGFVALPCARASSITATCLDHALWYFGASDRSLDRIDVFWNRGSGRRRLPVGDAETRMGRSAVPALFRCDYADSVHEPILEPLNVAR